MKPNDLFIRACPCGALFHTRWKDQVICGHATVTERMRIPGSFGEFEAVSQFITGVGRPHQEWDDPAPIQGSAHQRLVAIATDSMHTFIHLEGDD